MSKRKGGTMEREGEGAKTKTGLKGRTVPQRETGKIK